MYWALFAIFALAASIFGAYIAKEKDGYIDGNIGQGLALGILLPGISFVVWIVLKILDQKDKTRVGILLGFLIDLAIGFLIAAIITNNLK